MLRCRDKLNPFEEEGLNAFQIGEAPTDQTQRFEAGEAFQPMSTRGFHVHSKL